MTSLSAGLPRRARAVVAALGLLAVPLLLVGLAGPASAHDALISATPADGSTVEVAPETVELVFSAPVVALGTQVVVLGPDGTGLGSGDPVLVDATVSQPLVAERPAGLYTVQWRVTSLDGHTVTGQFTFSATSAAAPPVVAPPVAEPPVETPPVETPVAETPVLAPTDDPTLAARVVAKDSGVGVMPWVVGAGAAAVLFGAGAFWWVRRGQV